MRKFEAWGIAMLLRHIDHAREVIRPMAADSVLRDEQLKSDSLDAWITPNIAMAQVFAQTYRLESTYDRVWQNGHFTMKAKVSLTWQEADNELLVLRQAIESDLSKHTFAFILPERAALLENIEKNWSAVWAVVPDAKIDIEEAVYAYALERNTAAVFHLMRVAEWGLRAFCHHVGFRRAKSYIKKTGKTEFTPIEYSVWETIISQLRGKVNAKLGRLKRGTKKQELQEFYNPVLSEIEGFKDAWRNHVMHTRKSFNGDDAKAIMSHVYRFMDLLVQRGVVKI